MRSGAEHAGRCARHRRRGRRRASLRRASGLSELVGPRVTLSKTSGPSRTPAATTTIGGVIGVFERRWETPATSSSVSPSVASPQSTPPPYRWSPPGRSSHRGEPRQSRASITSARAEPHLRRVRPYPVGMANGRSPRALARHGRGTGATRCTRPSATSSSPGRTGRSCAPGATRPIYDFNVLRVEDDVDARSSPNSKPRPTRRWRPRSPPDRLRHAPPGRGAARGVRGGRLENDTPRLDAARGRAAPAEASRGPRRGGRLRGDRSRCG